MSTQSNILCFEIDRKPRINNVVRSTKYREKRDKLHYGKQRRLMIMEAKLFENEGGKCSEDEQLLYLEQKYVCDEGWLYYYYSENLRNNILIEFGFNSDGGGGLSASYNTQCSSADSLLNYAFEKSNTIVARWIDGVVYRLLSNIIKNICLNKYFTLSKVKVWTLNAYIDSKTNMINMCNVRDLGFEARQNSHFRYIVPLSKKESPIDSIQLIHDVMRCERILLPQSPPSHVALPKWSILNNRTHSPEQLRNKYTRSILAGEILCQLASFSAIAAPYDKANIKTKIFSKETDRHNLLSESQVLIRSLNTIDLNFPLGGMQHYLTGDFMSYDRLADHRRLHLVKSEVVLRLAIGLTSSINSFKLKMKKEICADAYEKILQQQQKRFALLTDFTMLTDEYFGYEAPIIEFDDLIMEMSIRKRKKIVDCAKFINGLIDFSTSIKLLIDPIRDRESIRKDVATGTRNMLSDNLVNLASEILAKTEDDNNKYQHISE